MPFRMNSGSVFGGTEFADLLRAEARVHREMGLVSNRGEGGRQTKS
jgi:hypothetical protein